MSPRRLVLASASPARLRTLRAAGVEPEVRVSHLDEEALTAPDPAALVLTLARAKAARVVRPGDEALVLGCDSLLDLDGQAHGKPASGAEVLARWERMAGRAGVLRTGHALLDVRDGRVVGEASGVASTTVRFGRPTAAELAAYVATGEPLQVAGAFTVDGLGGWFVDGLDGDAGTVIGLSLPLLRTLLGDLGAGVTDLWATNR
ncbi:MAG TPA: nucleoside triphosphate pyrophosphatase [Mycobacteriales bacterium]|nr:nucleoside triphosphate pyrophosphatase [Mycobacteriales bacterium]